MKLFRTGAALCLVALLTTVTPVSTMAQQEGAAGVAIDPVRTGTSLTLDQAIRIVLDQNQELEMAQLGLRAAEAQVREAWSAVYPTLNASANYTRNLDIPGQFLPAQIFNPEADPDELVLVRFGSDNSWFGQLRFEQPIFTASAFIGVGAASRYASLQREMVRGQTHAVVTRAKQLFFDVLLAEEAVRLNAESVRRVQQALEETEAMRRAGLVGDYDVLRLEVELANLQPALRRAENSAEAARRTLAVELGFAEPDEIQVTGSLTELAAAEVEAEGLMDTNLAVQGEEVDALRSLALGNRSEIRQARFTEQLRQAELRAEQSEYLPKLSFFANYSFSAQSNGGINPFGWNNGPSVAAPQAGLQVTIPLFNGFRRPARVSQLQSNLTQARTQTQLLRAQVENQVETLLEQVEESRVRAEAQQAAVAQARRGYEIASISFREGLTGRLELTDAEVALRRSEFNYAQALHDYLSARAQLDAAVGQVPEVQ